MLLDADLVNERLCGLLRGSSPDGVDPSQINEFSPLVRMQAGRRATQYSKGSSFVVVVYARLWLLRLVKTLLQSNIAPDKADGVRYVSLFGELEKLGDGKVIVELNRQVETWR